MNAHEVKPVRLIQSLCAVCGSNLAGLTLLYIVPSCVAAVVSRPAWRMLVLLIARYVSNLINGHHYYYYYYFAFLHRGKIATLNSMGNRSLSRAARIYGRIFTMCTLCELFLCKEVAFWGRVDTAPHIEAK